MTSSAISSRWSASAGPSNEAPARSINPRVSSSAALLVTSSVARTGTEPRQLPELGVPAEPLEEQAANLRHDLGRSGTEIDFHGSDTGQERFDRFQRDRQEHGPAAGVVAIDGRAAHAQLACNLGDPHVDPVAVDAPASGVADPLTSLPRRPPAVGRPSWERSLLRCGRTRRWTLHSVHPVKSSWSQPGIHHQGMKDMSRSTAAVPEHFDRTAGGGEGTRPLDRSHWSLCRRTAGRPGGRGRQGRATRDRRHRPLDRRVRQRHERLLPGLQPGETVHRRRPRYRRRADRS